jgi:hypothetical protein
MTVTATAASNFFGVYVMNDLVNASYAGVAGSGIFIWGAQLELGALTDYTRNVGGVFPARFDYDPVTLAPRGLLIEEQRANLLTYSAEFDNAAWSKVNGSVTANNTTAPDGTTTADLFVVNTSNTQHRVDFVTTVSAGTYSFSAYVKPSGYNFVWMRIGGNGGVANISTGEVLAGVTAGYTFTATAVGNGWYRLVLTGAAALNDTVRINTLPTGDVADYTGDGTSGIFLWGAQLEAGAFATSYIPTVASQVTRAADVAAITGPNFSSWYNQSAGTFVVEGDSAANINNVTVYRVLAAGSGGDALSVYAYNGRWGGSSRVGGVFQADIQQTGSFTANVPAKTAFAYATNDFAVSVSGSTPLTDTSGTIPTVTQLNIGGEGGTGVLNGHIRSIRYYPSRLTNAQLQALTA